jgi:hypothetical protein
MLMHLGNIFSEVVSECKPHGGRKLIEHGSKTWVIG